MHIRSLFLMFLLASTQSLAHPGWGLEVSETGTVYFTDLVHVWRIDADGQSRIHVANVHSHDLQLTTEGQLYGSHEWYDAAKQQFRRSFWRADAQGKQTTISAADAVRVLGVPVGDRYLMPHSDLHQQYTAFVHESDANTSTELYQQPMGQVDALLPQAQWGVFADWVVQGGVTYISSGGQIRSLDQQLQVNTVLGAVDGLPYSADAFSAILGLDVGTAKQLYLAHYEGREFLTYDGQKLSVLAESDWSWSATGIKQHQGHVYLMEYNRWPWSDAVQVRIINPQGQIRILGRNQVSDGQ
ncbi:hypothetical protein [Marinicella meishanensis]|uniref:hypothetical protein n=1 Tax=Marinicella meishanensis TaxID=2873263 RepID=UPI001CC0AB35|nr:hypothetical protein [Marinicella sp. NBU2979]